MSSLFRKKHIYIGILALAALISAIYVALQYQNTTDSPEVIFDEMVLTANGFNVRLVYPDSPEKGIILFLADNTDANKTTGYAKQFAQLSYYVAVIDSNQLLSITRDKSSQCINIAQELLDITEYLNRKLDLDPAILPILLGHNAGAALVYSALAQTEAHRFHAAVSIDFNGQLHNVPELCSAGAFIHSSADGTQNLVPIEHLSSTWYLFQEDKKIQPLANHEFTDQIANAKLTTQTDATTPVISNVVQILSWLDPRLSDQLSSDNSEGDLPLMEVSSEVDNPSQTLAVMLTGDGGWAEIDKGIAAILAEQGIPTVALDSLSYFWKRKTPEETAAAIEQIMSEYLAKWHKKRVILIGYSFGADVMPFIANQFTAENKELVALIVLLGIGNTAAFEFHLSSWMDADESEGRLPILPEVRNMSWAKSVCIYGKSDKEAGCIALSELGVKTIGMSGDHHFDERYSELVQHITDNIKTNQ